MMARQLWKTTLLTLCLSAATAFVPSISAPLRASETICNSKSAAEDSSSSRRCFLETVLTSSVAAVMIGSQPSWASESDGGLESNLYKVVRVREATQQESRLIRTGKFKDIQRANVKLAVRCMVKNYRLGDNVVAASAYLKGGNSIKAMDIGQTAIQNLQTILEYFDTSDVENIKVGKDSMAGKEALVLKGLEAAQNNLDQFLTFFPEETVQKVKALVREENELNVKEFDPALGDILNLPPPS
jgi:hypothetical protein